MTGIVWNRAWDREEGESRVRSLFARTFGAGQLPDGVWSAPGRINLIGEHTDYNGGSCLPFALPHRTYVALRRREDDLVRLSSGQEEGLWTARLSEVGPVGTPGEVSGWGAYVVGVAWALREAGHDVPGFDAVVDSCVPYGAGLSSSAALEAAFAVALGDASDDAARAALTAACVRAENEIAGAPTGGMDQSAALRSTAGHALLLDCTTWEAQQVPFAPGAHEPAGEVLVIDTRAPHQLVDGQYAARRAACEEAARTLGVATLSEVTSLPDALAQLPDDTVRRRVRHVVTEIARVDEVVGLLSSGGDLPAVGRVLVAGHESLRHDYEVTVPELDVAVEAAVDAGAFGARMVGGGFGGSVIALVPAGAASDVAANVAAVFAARGFAAPAFLLAEPSDAAS